jgi:hypothetical protein
VSCRSESPKYETDHENDHSDRPHDWYPGDEADEKKNQAENNHNASMVRTALIKPTATVTPNNGGAVTANNMMRM